MLCCVICYTFPDVSKNSNTYTSGLLISFFLDYIFSEDRGIATLRNVGNSLPVHTLQKKNPRRRNVLLSTVMCLLLYDFSHFPLSFSHIKQPITFSSEAKFR